MPRRASHRSRFLEPEQAAQAERQAGRFGSDGRSVAASSGRARKADLTSVVCVDSKRQWGRWRNVWYNTAIRSTGQTVTGPFHRRPKTAQTVRP